MSQPNAMMEALLNHTEPESRVIAHMVPTRVIRLIDVKNDGLTFRVEQLVEHGGFGTLDPKGSWRTLSTHSNPRAGGALGVAMGAAFKAQQTLVAKLRKKLGNQQRLVRP